MNDAFDLAIDLATYRADLEAGLISRIVLQPIRFVPILRGVGVIPFSFLRDDYRLLFEALCFCAEWKIITTERIHWMLVTTMAAGGWQDQWPDFEVHHLMTHVLRMEHPRHPDDDEISDLGTELVRVVKVWRKVETLYGDADAILRGAEV